MEGAEIPVLPCDCELDEAQNDRDIPSYTPIAS